ncbi:hypothetical protein EFB14_32740 [Rhizobium fabae]|uniref:Uncharacterized protein n=1 Tax=Rhizobium fabae TaxID=573179 RepID=A0ABY0AZG1_9HYPH|nr:hypothetical protein EFB14_32740 [Rhizobium fabae]
MVGAADHPRIGAIEGGALPIENGQLFGAKFWQAWLFWRTRMTASTRLRCINSNSRPAADTTLGTSTLIS